MTDLCGASLCVCCRVDPWETQQEGWTLTASVLKHFQETLNSDMSTCIMPLLYSSSIFKSLDAEGGGRVKLLCGADLLESFATPGLWDSQDVCYMALDPFFQSDECFISQIESIVKDYGLAVISRSGSNPEKFIYESDQLSQLQVP